MEPKNDKTKDDIISEINTKKEIISDIKSIFGDMQ